MLLGLLHSLPLSSCHGLAAAHRLRGGAALTLPPLVGAYQSALAAAPITTNVLSAASLSVLADGMAQAVERRGSWDVSRAAWISAWGASVSGLMLFFWFRLLARLFPLAASSTAQLVGKVALNQAVMSPGLNAGFFTFVVLTRDKAPPAALASATSCLVTLLLATYGLHRSCLVTSALTTSGL